MTPISGHCRSSSPAPWWCSRSSRPSPGYITRPECCLRCAWRYILQWVFVYWGIFLLLSGMFLCDLHLELEDKLRPRSDLHQGVSPLHCFVPRNTKPINAAYRVLGRVVGLVSLLFALWLLSMPEDLQEAAQVPGYVTITSWVPTRFQEALVIPVGAVLTVLIVDQATFLQILFSNRSSQYMGKISF